MDCLNGAEWITSLDLKFGYWQVEMEEDSKALTAFTVRSLGFYECEIMPFGLTNIPATFQWLMQSCLGNLCLQYCIIYLDDIIVFSKTPEEHLTRFRPDFEKLKKAEMKLKLSKCEFFKWQLTNLGHVVSKNGIQTDFEKVKAIHKCPVPTIDYHRFIKKYAQVAKPLYKLISGGKQSQGNRIQLNWIQNAKKLLISSKNYVPLHQF